MTMMEARRLPGAGLLAELEITRRCQLTCPKLCYAQAGPTLGTGSMGTDDWKRVIGELAEAGVGKIQLIGGEPTMHPDFAELVGHARGLGLGVEVATNLYNVPEALWAVLDQPGVNIAVSLHSGTAREHDEITGRVGSHARTLGNLRRAAERGIPIRGEIVQLSDEQDIDGARREFAALGATRISYDRVRPVGNAEAERPPTPADLCGRCGGDRMAVLADGSLTPCVLGRFLVAGSVTSNGVEEILTGDAWHGIREQVKAGTGRACPPADGNDCDPNDSDDI